MSHAGKITIATTEAIPQGNGCQYRRSPSRGRCGARWGWRARCPLGCRRINAGASGLCLLLPAGAGMKSSFRWDQETSQWAGAEGPQVRLCSRGRGAHGGPLAGAGLWGHHTTFKMIVLERKVAFSVSAAISDVAFLKIVNGEFVWDFYVRIWIRMKFRNDCCKVLPSTMASVCGSGRPPRWRSIRAADAGKQVTDFLNCQIINFSSAPKPSSTAHTNSCARAGTLWYQNSKLCTRLGGVQERVWNPTGGHRSHVLFLQPSSPLFCGLVESCD